MRTEYLGILFCQCLILAGVFGGLAACGSDPEPPYVSNAWIREMPPSATMSAAYFSLHNPTAAPLKIASISASGYREAQLHETLVVDGKASMRQQFNVTISPGETLRLQPGGKHLMLIGLVPDRQSETVDISIQFDDGWQLAFSAPVLADEPDQAGKP